MDSTAHSPVDVFFSVLQVDIHHLLHLAPSGSEETDVVAAIVAQMKQKASIFRFYYRPFVAGRSNQRSRKAPQASSLLAMDWNGAPEISDFRGLRRLPPQPISAPRLPQLHPLWVPCGADEPLPAQGFDHHVAAFGIDNKIFQPHLRLEKQMRKVFFGHGDFV
ncbi:hypothetical protein B7463_g11770, partial [Scytalidium lignicola]